MVVEIVRKNSLALAFEIFLQLALDIRTGDPWATVADIG